MQEYFKILGVLPTATDEEITNAYRELKEKYQKERFLEGEKGNEAAKNLTKIETAYQEIMSSRAINGDGNKNSNVFTEIESLIKNGEIALAQEKLDNINERNAEWHYLQSHIFFKKNWINESKKQLEIAINMEPENQKYSIAYSRLNEKIEFNNRQFQQSQYGYGGNSQENRQMGGTDSNFCVDYCLTMCCMNLMCNMCCNCR